MENIVILSSGDVIALMANAIAFLGAVFIVIQLRGTKLNNYLVNMNLLRKEEMVVRERMKKAMKELQALTGEIRENEMDKDAFYVIFSSKKYKNVRRAAYFYEYMGLIVKKHSIPFRMIFSLFSFPDKFWKSAEPLMEIVRQKIGIKDFWENFEYLHKRYEKKRQKFGSR